MSWGSFHFLGQRRPLRELGLAVVLMVLWSGIAGSYERDQLWITLPVFVLLAGAAGYTGGLYLRQRSRSYGDSILGWGFLL